MVRRATSISRFALRHSMGSSYEHYLKRRAGMAVLAKRQGLLPAYWVALALLLLALDYATGPYVRFPIFFILPIILASWYNGRRWGLALAFSLSPAHIYFADWDVSWTWPVIGINTAIQILVFSTLALFVDRAAVKTREVQVLSGLLPICSFCKKIRTPDNTWKPVEQYVAERSQAEFSHGICPECLSKHYGDVVGNSEK
jgi:hypothetical protein